MEKLIHLGGKKRNKNDWIKERDNSESEELEWKINFKKSKILL